MSLAAEPLSNGAYPRPVYAWSVVAILIGAAILSYTDRQVLSLLVDPIRHDLGISDTQVSLLLGSAFALIYGVAGLPLGYLADRVSRRNLIAAGLLIWSLATMAGSLAHSFGEIFASRIFVGLGEAALSPAAIALISDYFPPSRRGLAVGFFLSGIAMGSGVAIMLGGAVLQAVDAGLFAATPLAHLAAWRMVLVLVGLPGLAWCVLIFAIKEPTRRAASDLAPSASSPAIADVGPLRVSWAMAAAVYLVVAMASLVDNAVGAWAPSLLIREFKKSGGQIGLLLGLLLTVGFGGGVLVGGFLADKAVTLRRRLGVSLIAAALILPASLLMLAHSFTVVLLGVPLYFALSGVVTAVGFASILQVVPARARGLAMSISFFLNVALGAGVGPTAVSLAASKQFGPSAGLGPPIVFVACAGYATVLAALALARLFSAKVSRRGRIEA
jgi:MFS family permease